MNLILFTDLDGTLLDTRYSFAAAAPALDLIRKKGIPCIISSSKTRAEIEHYRKRLLNNHSFVSENGGGIFVPKNYFGLRISEFGFEKHVKIGEDPDYEIITLGTPYAVLRAALGELRKMGYPVTGFGDMTVEEIARATGLPIAEAGMAKQREFDEPFLFDGDDAQMDGMVRAADAMGLSVIRGRFHHLTGLNDKGKATILLSRLYRRHLGRDVIVVAIGDGAVDLPMLETADHAIIVKKPDGTYNPLLLGKGFIEADGIGPEGWNMAVLALLNEYVAKAGNSVVVDKGIP